jgi:CHAT domain-containing protein/Tfp pilus assembly protein PilF
MGGSIELEIAGEQAHAYTVSLTAGDFLHVTVDQRGVDVLVTVRAPGGEKLAEVDSPNGPEGPEEVYLIAGATGAYRIEVGALEKGAVGKYAIKLSEKRAATAADRELIAREASVKEAKQLIGEADSLRAGGRYAEGVEKAESALALFEKALDPGHIEIGNALNSLGLLYEVRGDYARAEASYRRALVIFEQVLGAEHPAVAAVLQNLAAIADARGDLRGEEELLRRSLTLYEKALGEEHPQVAVSLNALARLYHDKGEYGRAEPLYQRALAIDEKAPNVEPSALAFVINNLADLYEAKGDYERAVAFFKRALAIREQALGPEHPDVAYSLHSLGNLYGAEGEYAQAEALHRRALAIREKVFGPEHIYVANSLNNLAMSYRGEGDYRQAEALLKRSLAIYEKTFGPEHREVATILDNMGALFKEEGAYARAQALHRRALAIYERVLGTEHPTVATALNNLALLYDAKGDYAQAVRFFARSQEVGEHNLRTILISGSERQKQVYLDTLSLQTDYAVSLHLRSAPANEQAARLALTTILRRKGRVLDAMADQLGTLRLHATPQDQMLLDQLVKAFSRLAALQLSGQDKLSPEARRAETAQAASEVERLQAEISRSSAEFRTQSQPITLEAVRQAIPAGAALVEFFAYRPYDTRAKRPRKIGAARYAAYVLRRDTPTPEFADLGPAAPIDAAVERLRTALRDPKSVGVKGLAREVDRLVMWRVRNLLGKTRHVLIAPDGTLNLIPFAALADERNRYLAEDYSFTYLTSGRDLLRLQTQVASQSAPMVLADPLYDVAASEPTPTPAGRDTQGSVESRRSADFALMNFKPLPGTAEEAAVLAGLMPDARVLLRESATEAALKRVSRPRLLHIATHGFFLPDQPRAAPDGDETPRGTSDTLDAMHLPPRWENPLLRSGLVLAGVGQRQSGAGEDGVLTALETAGLDLRGTKLAVLSACETGLGEVRNGEGVYGLRRALVLAGSEAQVMSLWKVSDAGTRDLMLAYYTRLQNGEGRTEALRQVQLAMLRGELSAGVSGARRSTTDTGKGLTTSDYPHPYYWAAFIQSGDWRDMDGK